jgi:hypothetical protein
LDRNKKPAEEKQHQRIRDDIERRVLAGDKFDVAEDHNRQPIAIAIGSRSCSTFLARILES